MGHDASKLSLLGFFGMGRTADLDHFEAKTPEQREEIFRLRYDAYTRNNLIRTNSAESLSDWQDDEPDTRIYGITLEGRLVGTIRMAPICARRKAVATYAAFGDVIDPIVELGQTIADGSRLAVTCRDPRTRRRVFMYALTIAAGFAKRHDADLGAILARQRHVPFYKRHGFELIAGPFEYHEALTPLCLMMVNFPEPVAEVPHIGARQAQQNATYGAMHGARIG